MQLAALGLHKLSFWRGHNKKLDLSFNGTHGSPAFIPWLWITCLSACQKPYISAFLCRIQAAQNQNNNTYSKIIKSQIIKQQNKDSSPNWQQSREYNKTKQLKYYQHNKLSWIARPWPYIQTNSATQACHLDSEWQLLHRGMLLNWQLVPWPKSPCFLWVRVDWKFIGGGGEVAAPCCSLLPFHSISQTYILFASYAILSNSC